MHMADSLLSVEIGTVFAVISGTAIVMSTHKIENDKKKLPMIAVMAAFVFAAQMINFTIPGTGSSGHLGGAILLTRVLGPPAALLAISSVLIIQAFFFADGGLIALGTNIFNMGIIPVFIVYPFFQKWIEGDKYSKKLQRTMLFLSALIAVTLGALSVVIQTSFSGVLEINFIHFALLMLPIHLFIGIGEGLISISVMEFIASNAPALIIKTTNGSNNQGLKENQKSGIPKAARAMLILTLFIAAFLSWFASSHPDGLEWSIEKSSLTLNENSNQNTGHQEITFADKSVDFQEKFAPLPDYAIKEGNNALTEKAGTSLSGIMGSLLVMVFLLLFIFGYKLLQKLTQRHAKS
ncbi:MAG: energy-coupling factor ABC transporter permease [Candidatus Marinimicrobia bacterium]|nr:energy-coupling factor ABC transporter permease [Candidatus Neomarinimicrobiota bacterium]